MNRRNMDQESIRNFILENIHLRTASGKKSAKKKKNNAFGTVCFKGFGQEASRNAPYVKVSCTEGASEEEVKNDINNVWTLMLDYWGMAEPKLIISITGGAKDFDYANNRLLNSFKRGLMKAATSADAWIISGGTNAGVMEIVGEAVREHMLQNGSFEQNVVVLGIVTWGIIVNKTALRDNNCEGRFPCDYNFNTIPKVSSNVPSALLDPNHTHFIFVDSKKETFGGEIEFRTLLEQHRNTNREENELPVPVVLLVVEGGINTLKTAREAIESKTPVVIIEGFGRAADIVAHAWKLKSLKQAKKLSSSDVQTLKSMITKEFRVKAGTAGDERINDSIESIRILLHEENEHLLTVYQHRDEDSNHDIDEAIITAVLNANSQDISTQLNLALAFNRCDIAQDKIFSYENNENWKKLDLHEALFKALIQNKADFVKLFLDNGVDLKRYLTITELKNLYEAVLFERSAGKVPEMVKNIMKDMLQDWFSYLICRDSSARLGGPNLLSVVGKVINLFTDSQLKDFYAGDKYIVSGNSSRRFLRLKSRNERSQHAPVDHKNGETNKAKGDEDDETEKPPSYSPDFEHPERELLLWALLFNRKDLAVVFWRAGQDHVGGALTAALIMKSLGEVADKEEELDLAQEINENADHFEMTGSGVLNECHLKDSEMSQDLITRELDLWGNRSLFAHADNAELMSFMEHTCCQSRLNKCWKGRMALITPTWKILICLILPFLIPAMIKFTTDAPIDYSSSNEVVPESASSGGRRRKGGVGSLMGRRKRLGRVTFFKAIYYFETTPIVKFFYHSLAYLIFLGLFSFFMLTDLQPHDPSIAEYIIWVWAITMWLDEIRQLLISEATTFRLKLSDYFMNIWNQYDQVNYVLLLISVILRYTVPDEYFVWARMFYVVTLTMFFLRFLQMFYVSKNIGPKVIMIRRMVTDLLFFAMLLGLFLIAYGTAAQALLYPNTEPSWEILLNIVFWPYFNIYGEINIEGVDGNVDPCSNNATIYDDPDSGIPRCPEKSWLVMIFFSVYLILTNILLINLLIAMFSHTFEAVQENSGKVWRYYRYGLINEYVEKPALIPPLIIFSLIWQMSCYIYYRCCSEKDFSNYFSTDLRKKLDNESNQRLTAFERAGMENYFVSKRIKEQEKMEYKVTTTEEKVEKVAVDVECVKEHVVPTNDGFREFSSSSSLAVPAVKSPRASGMDSGEIHKINNKLEMMDVQLQTMMEMLKSALASQQQQQPPREAFQPLSSQSIVIRDYDHGTSTG